MSSTLPERGLNNGRNREARVTARQVADRAGVSISAVSRAFTDGASVAPETRKKILKASQDLGYQPNVMARSLMTGRTELVGLVSNNFDNPAYMRIFDLFTRGLQDAGLRPLLVNMSATAHPGDAVDMLRQYSVDGVIIASSTVPPNFVSGCIAAQIPLVHAFGQASSRQQCSVVAADNVQGGRLAAETLMDHGYRRMAFLGGPQTASSTRDRLKGFHAGLAARGIKPVFEAFAPSYSHDDGRSLMLDLLKHKHIDAVFCGDDIMAMGALDACHEKAIPVPGDIGIMGFNDLDMASWASYNLTTIRQPIAAIIMDAVQLAIAMIKQPGTPLRKVLMPCEVVLRGTLRKP
jgi:DNA-binding LacI/PurR family transcriptional regulator